MTKIESFFAKVGTEAVPPESTEVAALLARPEEEQRKAGYFHTLHEILQQPATWRRTARELTTQAGSLEATVVGLKTLVLTGSGSSEYAGECVRLPLQNRLGVAAQTIGGGMLLTHGRAAIGPGRPGLMVSFARSGDSPESVGAVAAILESEPEIRQFVVTCNAEGRLATTYRDDPRVRVVVLSKDTNDKSLVMTSSFTNMVLATSFLGWLNSPAQYMATVDGVSAAAEKLLGAHIDPLAEVARRGYDRVIYLASGAGLGAAQESALKMLEMTGGSVKTSFESYLGLRHGPMSAVHADTLIVCFLSSDPLVRAYESDLIRELNTKQLGLAKVIFGEKVPADLARGSDLVIDIPGLAKLGDDFMPVLDVLIGQLIAFFRCMKEGMEPDAPSKNGVISRVVKGFQLHRRER